MLDFLKHLVTRVKNVAEDTSTPPVPEESIFFNAPKIGVAYCFTNSGAKVKNPRKFSIDGKAEGKDDHSSTAACSKYYPKVARKITGIVMDFIWLMEVKAKRILHTRCAHIYQKLYKSCLMIKEACYLKNTWFHQGIFHFYSHGCSLLYSCKDLIGFRANNTSIC